MARKQTSGLLQQKDTKFYSRTDTKIYTMSKNAGGKSRLIGNFVYYTILYLSLLCFLDFCPHIIYLSNPAPLSY